MKRYQGYLITVIAALCWGFSGTMGEYLLNKKQLDASWLTSVRMLGAGIGLLLFILLKDKGISATHKALLADKKTIGRVVLYGITGLAFNQLTYLQAIHHSNSGTATVLQCLGIILLMLVVCFLNKRKPLKTEIFVIILSLYGTFLLATHGKLDSLALNELALIWGLSSAVSTVMNTLLPISPSKKYGSSLILSYGLLIGGIFLTVLFQTWTNSIHYDTDLILALLGMIIVGTILAYNLFLVGIRTIGSIKASLIAGLEPVAAIIFSMLLLGTTFVGIELVGSAIIIFATVLVSIIDLFKMKEEIPEK